MIIKKFILLVFGIIDEIKDFLLVWGIRIGIFLFICMIFHNVVKMSEISTRYTGEYKKLVEVYPEENKMMNIYATGSGSKTIVILPGFGSQSPIMQYKTLVDGLKSSYRVVVVEYFGYGYSMGIDKERTNSNISYEIKKALESAEISGPYILMPHSLSNVYAMHFESTYPELVQAIISIDGLYPVEVKDKYHLQKQNDNIANIRMTSIFELTGFERVLSYVSPKAFYIDKMKAMPDIYGKEEISIYRNRIGSSYLTRTMVREIENIVNNMNEMQDYAYPEYLPVLSILSSDSVAQYDNAKAKLGASVDLKQIAEYSRTNTGIQKVQIVTGDHMLQLSNPNELLTKIENFLVTIY